MGVGPGADTYSYAHNRPIWLVDPEGLCPAVFDTGQFDSFISRDKCIMKGKVAHYEFQDRSQFVGNLIGQEGDCGCGQTTQICIYSLVFRQAERRTPCGGGAFSPWDTPIDSWPFTLRAPMDCKSGKFDSKGLSLTR